MLTKIFPQYYNFFIRTYFKMMNMFMPPSNQMTFFYFFLPSVTCFPMQTQNSLSENCPESSTIEVLKEQPAQIQKISLTKEDLEEIGYQKKKKPWTESEDKLLLRLCSDENARFEQISQMIPGRNAKMCYSRYRRLTNQVKQVWTEQENNRIIELVQQYGEDWKRIAQFFKRRNDKQLKDHYLNYLRPNLSKDEWSIEQDLKLIDLINKYGKNQKLIEQLMSNRSRNQIKNRFFGRIKKFDEQKKKHEKIFNQ